MDVKKPLKEEEIVTKLKEVYKKQDKEESDGAAFEKKYKFIDKEGKYIYSILDLIKLKSQRFLALKLCLVWFTIGTIYYILATLLN